MIDLTAGPFSIGTGGKSEILDPARQVAGLEDYEPNGTRLTIGGQGVYVRAMLPEARRSLDIRTRAWALLQAGMAAGKVSGKPDKIVAAAFDLAAEFTDQAEKHRQEARALDAALAEPEPPAPSLLTD